MREVLPTALSSQGCLDTFVLPAEMHGIGVTEAGSPSSDTPQPSLSLSALTFSNADPQPGTAGSRGGRGRGGPEHRTQQGPHPAELRG